jgi:hypothetical protein
VDVVVAVDIWGRGVSLKILEGGWGEGPAAQPIFETYDGRSVSEATVDPYAIVRWNQVAKIPDERRLTGLRASIGLGYGAARGTQIRIEERRNK